MLGFIGKGGKDRAAKGDKSPRGGQGGGRDAAGDGAAQSLRSARDDDTDKPLLKKCKWLSLIGASVRPRSH